MSAQRPSHHPNRKPKPDPGEVLRAAHARAQQLAAVAPPGWTAPAPPAAISWAFEQVYAQTPAMTTMRESSGGVEVVIHRQSQQPANQGAANACTVSPMESMDFARQFPNAGRPGEGRFGFGVVYCVDEEALAMGSVFLPAGERLYWPPPLTYMPGLDPLCNVLYHTIKRTPVEVFGNEEKRARFREALFLRVLPTIFGEAHAAHRRAGRGFLVTLSADGEHVMMELPAQREQPPEMAFLYQNITPGEEFPLVFDFLDGIGDGGRAGDLTQVALPCMPAWPTDWVRTWLAERPGSDACRRCGAREVPFKRCSACREVRYCSTECQRADWRRHKQECVLIRRA